MNEKRSVFDFKNYRSYLLFRAQKARPARGFRSALAASAGIQAAYLSSVFAEKADLSLEQGQRVSQFLGHTKDESHYFLLILQKDRAGTEDLKNYFQEQMDRIREQRSNLSTRLSKETRLKDLDQAVYYSSWLYAGVHVALTIPHLQQREKLVEHFQVPIEKINVILSDLLEMNLIEAVGENFVAKDWVRLGKDSKHLLRHHTHWRLKAIESLEFEGPKDLHYSGVYSLSKQDLLEIKESLLEKVQEIAARVKSSKEEELCGFTMDLFVV